MRRLEMLSNTIFGVAMTLLAYDLPKASGFANAPAWIDLVRAYAQPLIALTISFIVAGLFWFSHHRRLAIAPEAGRGVVFLNLLFLLSIIMLPVTNGLYGIYRLDGVVAVIYGVHLTMIATLNALLWVLALKDRGDPELLVTALFPVFVFVLGTAVAFVAPSQRNSSGVWLLVRRWQAGWRRVGSGFLTLLPPPPDGHCLAGLEKTTSPRPAVNQVTSSLALAVRQGLAGLYRCLHVSKYGACILACGCEIVQCQGFQRIGELSIFVQHGFGQFRNLRRCSQRIPFCDIRRVGVIEFGSALCSE